MTIVFRIVAHGESSRLGHALGMQLTFRGISGVFQHLDDIAEDPDELRTLYGTAEGNRVLPGVLKLLERLQAGEGR